MCTDHCVAIRWLRANGHDPVVLKGKRDANDPLVWYCSPGCPGVAVLHRRGPSWYGNRTPEPDANRPSDRDPNPGSVSGEGSYDLVVLRPG